MQLLTVHLLVFLQISIACLFFSISGFILKYLIFKKKDFEEFFENGLFGFILIGFISLGLNFFFPLNLILNNIIFFVIFILAIVLNFFSQNFIKLIKNIFFVSLISYLFLIYSDVNRPDGYTYHLPYSQIINDHKIILGLSNLQFRYGHISIFQYISSFFVNSIYSKNGLLVPISLVPSFFYIYCVNRFLNEFDNIKTRLNSYFIFLLFVISVYALSRYSGWGNDAQVHIFYFLTIIYLLDLNNNNKNNLILFNKLFLTCLFTFLIKPFHLINLLIPFVYFILNKKKVNLIKIRPSFFILIFFLMWILKNVFVSSCAIYPLSFTCIDKLSWFNKDDIFKQSLSGEAWSKDWINRDDKSLNHEEYIKDFNWVKTWSKNHFKIVLEKATPVFIFLILNLLLFFFTRCLKRNFSKENNIFFGVLFSFCFLTVFLWFIKFPLYRFGISYIFTFMILVFYFIYIKNIDLKKMIDFKIIFIIIIGLSFFGLFIKNASRIYETKNTSIYPYLMEANTVSEVKQIYDLNGQFSHYKSDSGSCSVSKSPCTHFDVKVIKNKFFGYKIFKIYE